MNFQQFVTIVRARWPLVLAVLAGVLVLSLALSLILPPRYTAVAAVVVDITPDPLQPPGSPVPLLTDYMQMQQDIVLSEHVAQRVVKLMHLDESARFRAQWQHETQGRGDYIAWLGALLRKRISVPPSTESNVINISAKWPDAKGAAELANAYAQAYIDTSIELRMQSAKQYSKWFQDSSSALHADLAAKQKLLSDYENTHGLVASDERLDIENRRLEELETQLVTVQEQRQDSQSRQSTVVGQDDSRPEVLQSSLISNLTSELSTAEAQQQDLATQLGRNHPEYLRNEAKIQSLRAEIAEQNKRIVSSLGQTTRVNQRRESQLSAALAAQKAHLMELKHQRDEAAVLQNDVIAAQRNLDAVSQRLAQSNLQAHTPQTNIALLTAATEPAQPSSPLLTLNLLIGLVLGAALGLGSAVLLEKISPRIRTDRDLLLLLGLPLLAKIRSVAPQPQDMRRLSSPFHGAGATAK